MEMPVGISSVLLARLIAEAAATSDVEVCGLLFGDGLIVEEARSCRNVAEDPATQFEIDPVALIAAHRTMRERGPRMIGHYHSHPSGVPEPSACDAESAGEGELWLIIGAEQALLWRARHGGAWLERFDPVAMVVTPPCVSGLASS